MSSLALMRWLESAPGRYDAGMRVITLGRVEPLRDAVVEPVQAGHRVLEIGCGTGAVTERLVRRGAQVTALDQSAEMLARAKARCHDLGPGEATWLECTAAEIDSLPEAEFDAVVSSFCLSEMSAGERRFVLEEAARRLKPGGQLSVGDEVWPERAGQRLAYRTLRWPQAAAAWLLAGAMSVPIRDLPAEIESVGLRPRSVRRWLMGSLVVVVAERAP